MLQDHAIAQTEPAGYPVDNSPNRPFGKKAVDLGIGQYGDAETIMEQLEKGFQLLPIQIERKNAQSFQRLKILVTPSFRALIRSKNWLFTKALTSRG